MTTKLLTRADIETMVQKFYGKVQKDDLIGPIFNEKAQVNWDAHLPKMYNFWEDLLLGSDSYRGRPFPPHIPLGLTREHFNRWVYLFLQTIDENFDGAKADEARYRAQRIALNFQINLGLIQIEDLK